MVYFKYPRFFIYIQILWQIFRCVLLQLCERLNVCKHAIVKRKICHINIISRTSASRDLFKDVEESKMWLAQQICGVGFAVTQFLFIWSKACELLRASLSHLLDRLCR